MEPGAVKNMRGLPAVHRFLSDPQIAAFEALFGKELVKRTIAGHLDALRRSNGAPVPAYEELRHSVLAKLERERMQTLLRVVNATGVILHTNLGRAPLAESAIDAVREAAAGYSNLEYDVESGTRGSRYERASALLRSLTGAQDALIVNNCAAAVLLILDAFAKGREVVVARNQLVEVGGGFRLPDVLQRSGATLVEVGATNKVYLADFAKALSPQTALLLRSHASNYRISGFTQDVDPRELAALGRRAGVPVVEDLGSGALVDLELYGLAHERTVQDAISDGMDLVAFSGDKVLGGPQAGIIAGAAPLIARLRNNPLLRALRVDKMTFAALIQTLRLYATPERRSEIPFFAMLGAKIEDLRERARRYCSEIPGAAVVDSAAYAGGGTLPQSEFPSVAVALVPRMGATALAQALRLRETPIVARIDRDRVFLDMRTIRPPDDAYVIAALRDILA